MMTNQQNPIKFITDLFDFRYFNAWSTTKSSIGFILSMVGVKPRSKAIQSVFNYLPISDQLATSGQPTIAQFGSIQAAGFSKVINLAPRGGENTVQNEKEIVEGLGMDYIHIPVDFQNPTEQDFQDFCRAMSAAADNKVFVHCAVNMRVSAFIYRYRTHNLGISQEVARQDLEKIWQPFGVWAEFIER
jgi:uncharacterized protein (TIGR01244 family)